MRFASGLLTALAGAALIALAPGASAQQQGAEAPAAATPAAHGTAPAAAAPAAAQAAPADAAADQLVAQRFEKRFPGIHVEHVRPAAVSGMYEVQVGLDLLYTDADVRYVFQGALIDAREHRDLTAERQSVLQREAFEALPLDDAIVQVHGAGTRRMVTFEDPECPYCRQLQQALQSVDDVTVYTFLFPILTPASQPRSQAIWCADDRAAAWDAWMLKGQAPAPADCDTPLQRNLKLGARLNVQGTPAVFFPDGGRVNGAMTTEAINEALARQSGEPAPAAAKR